MKTSCLLLPTAGVLLSILTAADGGLSLTDTTNITLANSQVETGGDTSDNPIVVSGSTGALLPYTDSVSAGYCCGATYDGHNFDDGDVGVGVPSDGFYGLPNDGTLTLDFAPGSTLGSIAIYNGYANRDDGTYILTDGTNTLGAWTITNTPGATNEGVDSFWLTFNTPVTTNQLVLTFDTTETQTPSFREIQVFEPVPEPNTAVLAIAATLLTLRRRRA